MSPKPTPKPRVMGFLPADTPPWGAMLSLGFQQVLTMFPATVLVAILTKFDVGVTLLASGVGTIIALLVSQRKIPMYYGSSFSYIAVVVTAMSLYAGDCFSDPATVYCADGVRLVQVGIIGTGLVNILVGLLIMRLGKAALDRILPPIVTGSMAVVIGVALSGAALNMAGCLHHPHCHHPLLGLPARKGFAGDAAHPLRRNSRLRHLRRPGDY